MQLTRFTDYTLRVLISVGLSRQAGVTISEIADQYGISRNHLMKVVHALARAGYLETIRGKGGGLRLALPATEINLGEVVRETEGSFAVVPCFDRENPHMCTIAPVCLLKGVLHDALQSFLEVLDGYTLADLLKPERALRNLLVLNSQRNAARRPAQRSRS
jgi:Rrf2 family nitric oxide-sensitive transcriptional repressor